MNLIWKHLCVVMIILSVGIKAQWNLNLSFRQYIPCVAKQEGQWIKTGESICLCKKGSTGLKTFFKFWELRTIYFLINCKPVGATPETTSTTHFPSPTTEATTIPMTTTSTTTTTSNPLPTTVPPVDPIMCPSPTPSGTGISNFMNGSSVINAEGGDGSHNPNGTWTVEKAGSRFLVTNLNSYNEASGFLAPESFGGVDLTGEFWEKEKTIADDDFIGVIFSYKDPGHFYAFSWKQKKQSDAFAGFTVQLIQTNDFSTQFSKAVNRALWHRQSTEEAMTIFTSEMVWKAKARYSFRLSHRPSLGIIRVQIMEIVDYYEEVVIDTGNISNLALSGGKIGCFSIAQAVHFEGFKYTCKKFGMEYFRWSSRFQFYSTALNFQDARRRDNLQYIFMFPPLTL